MYTVFNRFIPYFICCFMFSLTLGYASLYEPSPKALMLCLTMDNKYTLPRNYRSMRDLHKIPDDKKSPSLLGLNKLKASGSAQFSEQGFLALLDNLPVNEFNVLIVDLREESHGFINGSAVTWRGENDWGNIHKSDEEIIEDEHDRLNTALNQKLVSIQNDKNNPFDRTTYEVKNILTEYEFVASFGIDYYRLTLTDHIRPTDVDVDTFIEFMKSLPKDTWVHFHCAAGKGRTSTFLTMLDMLHNAKTVSLSDIFTRQALLGGKNFQEMPDSNKWNYFYCLDRIEFLRDFYRFCSETNGNISWSDWNKNNN